MFDKDELVGTETITALRVYILNDCCVSGGWQSNCAQVSKRRCDESTRNAVTGFHFNVKSRVRC